jgi:hypothetical protein
MDSKIIGDPWASVPEMNKTSLLIFLKDLEQISAGRNVLYIWPRCKLPLAYGSAAVIMKFDSFLFLCFNSIEKKVKKNDRLS